MDEGFRELAGVTIREARVAEILELRARVLRAGIAEWSASFPGDELATTRHVAAIHDGRTVGCATILLNEWSGEPAWQLRGMAVDGELRSTGIGRRLLDLVEELVERSPTQLMWCNARVPAIGFYQRMGWTVVSDEFEIPTAGPHRRMIKRL